MAGHAKERFLMVWSCEVPLPEQWLSSNYPAASVGVRQAKAASAARWKAVCVEIFKTCPIRSAKFIRVSQHWYCVNNDDLKAKPKRGKTEVSKSARKTNPYMPTDVFNALASCKTMIDAIAFVGIVADDTAEFVGAGNTDLWRTQKCRRHGITIPHILVTLEIVEEETLFDVEI
jgi:hypothetical protein